MSRKSVAAEVKAIQSDTERLAREPVPESADYRALHETTTVALRLSQKDALSISALASEQGVPVSTLLRGWVLAGLHHEQGDSVGATLSELEQGLRRLRKALG